MEPVVAVPASCDAPVPASDTPWDSRSSASKALLSTFPTLVIGKASRTTSTEGIMYGGSCVAMAASTPSDVILAPTSSTDRDTNATSC